MSKNYVELGHEFETGVRALGQETPDIMGAFRNLAAAASKDGALDCKTKELMALAIGITTRCDGCIAFHMKNVLKAGATKAEITETIGVAIEMGGGPAMVYGVGALEAYEQFTVGDASSDKLG